MAKQTLEELNQASIDGECVSFFRNMESVNPRRRLSLTYRFLKQYRRKKSKSALRNIPISHWEIELRNVCLGKAPVNIAEDDNWPIDSPPTPADIKEIIQRMKTGTTPGQDRLQAELFKYGPPELAELISLVTSRAWCNNDVPDDWLNTTQVPLPKVRNPKTISDFRRITMSNVIYKIYAAFLLSRLQRYIDEVSVMRFLGIYISSDINRRGTISTRIQAAYKSFYMLLPFLRANRLPLTTILRLYHTAIVPIVMF